MLSAMSATDVAFIMAGLMQAVLAILWLLGSWLVGDTRHAAVHWASYAGLSAISFVLLTAALHAPPGAEALRACGNICAVGAFLALQRGIWLFVGRRPRIRGHVLALGVTIVASYLGLSPVGASLRISITSAVLASLAVAIALDLYAHARDDLRFRRPWIFAVPLISAAVGFAFR